MSTLDRRHLLGQLGALALLGLSPATRAQTAAAPAITRIVLPLPAGGGVDVFVRKLAEVMGKSMGGTVIVDNKPGASGQIAVQAVASAPADGSALLYVHSGILTAQALGARIDLLRDFKPLGKISSSPHVLVVGGSSPYKTQAELIKAIQSMPDKLNYGSGGKGSPTHLMFEQLDDKVPGGLKATHIPFKGAVEAVVAIMSGSIDFTFAPLGSVQEQLKAGKLRALATTGASRMSQLANVPTVAEAGAPGYLDEPWGGLAVPAATPDAQVNRLLAAMKAAVANPDLLDMVAKVGGKIETTASPAAFSALIRDEIAADKLLVVKLGLKAE